MPLGKRKYGGLKSDSSYKYKARKSVSRSGKYVNKMMMVEPGQVNKMVKNGVEIKRVGLSMDPGVSIISDTGTNGCHIVANLINPGSGSYNRVGRKIELKSLRLKTTAYCTMSCDYADNAGLWIPLESNYMRMVVLYDRSPGTAVPQWSDIFGRTNKVGTVSSSIEDGLRQEAMERFRVLRDKTYICNPMPASNYITIGASGVDAGRRRPSVQQRFFIDEFIDLRGYETTYRGATVDVQYEDIASGAIIVFYRAYENEVSGTDIDDAHLSKWNVSNIGVARLAWVDA